MHIVDILKKIKLLRRSVVLLTGLVATSAIANTIQFEVGSLQYKAFGWPATNSTVGAVFAGQSIPNLTQVHVYNEGIQSWQSTTYSTIFSDWLNPSLAILSGRGFIIKCGAVDSSTHTFTFNYTPRSAGTLQITLTYGNLYYLSYAWDFGDGTPEALEQPWGQYSGTPHLYWPGSDCGDTIVWDFSYDGTQWNNEEVRRAENSRKWDGTSVNYLPLPFFAGSEFNNYWDRPFMFQNDCETRTWTQSSTVGQE